MRNFPPPSSFLAFFLSSSPPFLRLTSSLFSLFRQIWNSSWVPNDAEVKYPAMMTDLVLVDCFLPDSPVMARRYDENVKGTPAAGLMISVSNNGFSQSDQKLKFISYDSVCLNCNSSQGCFLKASRHFNIMQNARLISGFTT